MSQNQGASLRQDYICKIRYHNDLPPPPCPPKLLKYHTFDQHASLSDPDLLTSLFRKENFKNLISTTADLKMPLNLLEIPGLIETNDAKLLLASKSQFQLHPDDLLLLVDPLAYNKSAKSQPVSFLRRTQYIAERSSSPSTLLLASASTTATSDPLTTTVLLLKKRKLDSETNAQLQVRAVEATFEKAQELEETPVDQISHPTKKRVKARKIWNFLPDVSVIDKNFISLKFNGSASVTRTLKPGQQLPKPFETSVFRPVNTEHGEEWVSLFTAANDVVSDQVRLKLNDTKENLPIDEASILDEAAHKYTFNHYRDYDMVFKRFENEKEVAISFDRDSSVAFFSPINGRIDLKRRRVTPALERLVKEYTVDRIELSVREPTTGEAIRRDNARSRYDPINYIEHEDEDEEEKEEKEEKDEEKESGDESKTD